MNAKHKNNGLLTQEVAKRCYEGYSMQLPVGMLFSNYMKRCVDVVFVRGCNLWQKFYFCVTLIWHDQENGHFLGRTHTVGDLHFVNSHIRGDY